MVKKMKTVSRVVPLDNRVAEGCVSGQVVNIGVEKMTNTGKEESKSGFYNPGKMSEAFKHSIETASNVNKMSLEMLNSIAKLQTAFVKQMFADVSSACKCKFDAGKMNEQFKTSSEKIKENIEKNISHGKQIAEMMTSTGSQITDLLKTRFSESVESFKKSSKK